MQKVRIHLLILQLLLLVLPFVAAFVHVRFARPKSALLYYYRYFLLFNMVLVGVMVIAHMLLLSLSQGPALFWVMSPLMGQYGVVMLSVVAFAILTLFSPGTLQYASAIFWVIFLILEASFNLNQMPHKSLPVLEMIGLHILYDYAVAVVLSVFLYRFYKIHRHNHWRYMLSQL